MNTKQTVLEELYRAAETGNFVSGQEFAEKAGLSRAAVWKAVTALRTEGVKIEAVPKLGYRLTENGSFLDAEIIRSRLPADSGIKIRLLDITDSTNSEADRIISAAKEISSVHKTAVIAGEQTAGRGRLGRKFYSPAATGLYISLIYVPGGSIQNPAVLTATAAVAVCRAIKKIYGAECGIKWVNDIYLDGKKICGILTEGRMNFETGRIEAAIVGIGVNITTACQNFPDGLGEKAGSILGENGDARRNLLAAEIIREVLGIYDSAETDFQDAIREYREKSVLTGKRIEISPVVGTSKENYPATVIGITDDAGLEVRLDSGETRVLHSGEISLHGTNLFR